MAKSSNQKLKILYLMKIFLSETDETHSLTIAEIISRLADFNIKAERKTIYDDIEALRQFGLDIQMKKTKTYDYFIGARDFELPELKLLVDAVQSSKFITTKKSNELIKKIGGLASRFDSSKLQRQVVTVKRIKTANESIYYNVDAIYEAIANNRKISFQYFDYNIKKEKAFRKNGLRYIASPIFLTWNDENYYLVSKSADYDGLTHYRVDKMTDISLEEELRVTADEFNIADYSKKVFGMYGGDEQPIRLRFANSLTGVIIDRFGNDVTLIKDGEDRFIINVNVALSPVFIGWLFQFGDMAEVLSPQSLIEELKKRAKELLRKYR